MVRSLGVEGEAVLPRLFQLGEQAAYGLPTASLAPAGRVKESWSFHSSACMSREQEAVAQAGTQEA